MTTPTPVRAERRCRWAWLAPLAGFAVTALLGVGASLGNEDNRFAVQLLGLALFTALAISGGCLTGWAWRRFREEGTRRCLYHALGGLAASVGLALLTGVSAATLYRFQQPPTHPLPAHTPAEFRPAAPYRAPLPVWIDTDPACGEGATADVDDCWALLVALRSPELAIRGIGSVFGNAPGARTLRIAREVVRRFGAAPLPPVFEGASAAGAPRWPSTPASLALAEALRREKLTIIAQGPLTNIATVLLNHPELAARIERIVLIGGRRPGKLLHPGKQWWFHFRDFNIRKDTPAAKAVLDSGAPLVLIPFDLAAQVNITRADLARVEGDAAAWLGRASEPWLGFWEGFLHRPGFYPFDALAVAYLITPDQFQCQLSPARIGFSFFLEPFGMGRDLEVAPTLRGPTVYYCTGVDAEVKQILIERFATPAQA